MRPTRLSCTDVGIGEFLDDLSRKAFVDLTVTGYRLADSCHDIAIPVMVTAMTDEHNRMISRQLANEVKLFHAN